jgi:hypothetical protein
MRQSISSVEPSWIWIERLQKASGFTDPFMGGLIGLLIFSIFFIIGRCDGHYIIISKTSFIEFIASLASGIVIAYQIPVILFLIRILKDIPSLMKIIPDDSKSSIVDEMRTEIMRKFSARGPYYRFVFLILLPFLAIDCWFFLIRPDRDFLLLQENQWNLAFEISGLLIAYFIEYLIATIIWIILNIYEAFKLLGNSKFQSAIQLDLFSIDGIGGLGKTMDSTKRIAVCYFTCMTLAILAFLVPLVNLVGNETTKFYLALTFVYILQIILYVVLLLIGLYYIWSIHIEIRDIFNKYILKEICDINKIYGEKRNRLRMKLSEINKNADYDEINQLHTALEIIDADRENLTRIAKSGYNISVVVTIASSFIGSLVLPILTMIKLVQGILNGG